MKKILIITDSDLDGASCNLVLRWALPTTYDITTIFTTVTKFRNELLDWLKKDKLSNYDLVFICDLDVSSSCELIDFNNVYIIDHHESHNSDVYKLCKRQIKKAKSATGMIYELFLANKNISKEKLSLIKLVDDYDSFTLKYKQSKELNIIYWSLGGNKPLVYCEEFKDGFTGFTKFQVNTIQLYNNKLEKIIKSLQLYNGKVTYNGNLYKCIATFAEFAINDIAEYLSKLPDNDIVLIVNLKSETVSIRKSKTCNVNLSDFAKFIGNGGGHADAAGCPLNEQIMELLKEFNLK